MGNDGFGFEKSLWEMLDIIGKAYDGEQGISPSALNFSFPPCDIYKTKDKELVLNFAVAGYEDKDIGIEFEEHVLKLTFASLEADPKVDHYICSGIKKSSIVRKIGIPEKFDIHATAASMKNGILKITIPIKADQAPTTIKIVAE